jgi:hypothetical protein
MKMSNDFVAFIISHGRPDNIKTYATLRRLGYTGDIRIVIDNLDKRSKEYYDKYGKEVIEFDKVEIAKTTDQGDNFNNLRTTTHARNAVFNIAKDLGYKYFVVLDDDYVKFDYRFDDKYDFNYKMIKNLDDVFKAIKSFLIETDILSISLAQGGDFIGGAGGSFAQQPTLKRKCMNSFFCATDRPFKFISRLNEDVNTYLTLGKKGFLFFTSNQVMLTQVQTQTSSGGMSDAYLDFGTYVKSFYSVMYLPSCVKVKMMHTSNKRLHHAVSWKNTVPCILREDIKKRA